MNVLTEIDLDETAEEVFLILDSIDVQDCWDRSGGRRDGYTSPDEAAAEIMEEELQPFFDQVVRYHELGMPEQEATYCMGVILGICRYERESKVRVQRMVRGRSSRVRWPSAGPVAGTKSRQNQGSCDARVYPQALSRVVQTARRQIARRCGGQTGARATACLARPAGIIR
jgi:hypothetical protein